MMLWYDQHAIQGWGRAERLVCAAVLFLGAWYLCLPVANHVELPWWASKVSLGTALIHEVVYLLYFLCGGYRLVVEGLLRGGAQRVVVYSLLFLAVWCAVVSLLAPYPFHDAGRSARLIVLALMLLSIVRWASLDPALALRSFLAGLIASSAVNLVFTFQHPVSVGVIPRLLGQNSPGPPMGLALCLAAWLLLLSPRTVDMAISLLAFVVCGIGAMISYSKIGMFAALAGLVSIFAVGCGLFSELRGRLILGVILIAALGLGVTLNGPRGRDLYRAFSDMVSEKLASAQPSRSTSLQERWSYVVGVAEIVSANPAGVGYSGFRGAMMATSAHRDWRAADESRRPADESNPHAMFLYYASAGGIIGGLFSVAIFGLLCLMIKAGLSGYATAGLFVAAMTVASYFIAAISVPYLFNSIIMIAPAGVAYGMWTRRQSRGHS